MLVIRTAGKPRAYRVSTQPLNNSPLRVGSNVYQHRKWLLKMLPALAPCGA